MKNKLNYFIIGLLFTLINCFLFVSCNNDNDAESGGSNGDSRIVGKWYSVHSDHTQSWYFEDNGTCNYGEWGHGSPERYSKTVAKWSVNGNYLQVRWTYEDGDFDDYIFVYVISHDGLTLTLSEGDGGKTGVYVRQ